MNDETYSYLAKGSDISILIMPAPNGAKDGALIEISQDSNIDDEDAAAICVNRAAAKFIHNILDKILEG